MERSHQTPHLGGWQPHRGFEARTCPRQAERPERRWGARLFGTAPSFLL